MVREGFARFLGGLHGIDVIGEASDGLEALDLAEKLHPDIALFDVGMPRMGGIEATRRMRKAHPDTGILIVSVEADDDIVVQALRAGAQGYILKSCDIDDLERAVRAVAEGQTYLHKSVASAALQRLMTGDDKTPPHGDLTPRQQDVLRLIAEGYATKEVAHLLSLSPKTVETHRAELLQRLNARGVADLVRHAIRTGLTRLNP